MNNRISLTAYETVRTRTFLFFVGLRKRLTVGARAILLDGNKVLLIKHTYLPGWQFPGGGVEPGEAAMKSAEREVMEETGYMVRGPAQLHGFYLNRLAGGARDHVAVYVWRDFQAQRTFVPNSEIAEIAWFEIDTLPIDTEAGTRRRIAEIVEGRSVALEW
jgi:8-oxo-dGTP pyrophosphatase MutT (NUDIX family)